MGKLSSKNVYIKVKNKYHLNELFDLCIKYNQRILHSELNEYEKSFSYNPISQEFSNYFLAGSNNCVTIEQFEQLLKSEQNGH